MRLLRLTIYLGLLGFVTHQGVARACHDGSPLILDLNGDGVRTVDANHAVWFDIDADGSTEKVTWTFWESQEGFLAVDRNRNGRIDDGSELFGDATLLPSGEPAENGFEALAVYDKLGLGGNGDGLISQEDRIWGSLQLWIDANQDGSSQPEELSPMQRFGVVGIGLDFVESDQRDGNGNRHLLKGAYARRVVGHGLPIVQDFAIHDVFFRIIHGE